MAPEKPLRIAAVGAVKLALAQALADPALPAWSATFDTVGGARDRVLAGEAYDIVFGSAPALDALAAAARISGPRIAVGCTGAGLAVPAGAPALDIATPEKLAAVLRAAPAIAMADPASGATAGKHFAAVLAQLGLAEALAPRISRHANGMLAVAEVAAGRAALGVSQGTEILAAPGVALGGMIPEPLQQWTVYSAARVTGGDPRAQALLEALAAPPARAAFTAIGFLA